MQFDVNEDPSAGFKIAKNIYGLDFNFKLDQEFNENLDKNAEISIWDSPTGKQILDIFIKLEEITSRKIKYNFLEYRKIFEKIIMEEEINNE